MNLCHDPAYIEGKWVKPTNQRRKNHPKWKEVDTKVGMPGHKGQKESKGKFYVPLTYKGNNPMMCTQWRCYQRKKKTEKEAFTTQREAPGAKHNAYASKAHKKPYPKRFNKENQLTLVPKIASKEAHMGKGAPKVRENTLEYSPQSKDETPEYTPQFEEEEPQYTSQPEDKEPEYTPQSDDGMVEDNFDDESKDELQINGGIVSVLPVECDRVSEVS